MLAAVIAALAPGDTATSAVAGSTPRIEMEEALSATLAATGHASGACHTSARDGAGIVSRSFTVGAGGPINATLRAGGGDWDLAIFDETGHLVAAAASADADEVASGWAVKPGTLTVQACRRSGDADDAQVVVEHGTIPQAFADQLRGEKIKAVSVVTPTRAEKERLTSMKFDMTEHGGREELGVILHGAADEQRLRDAGFRFRVLEDDMVERTIRDRTADRRYAARTPRSPVPSGRTEYRRLADYEDELKTLVEQNPGLVKLITLPEPSGLGREVLGIEIAENVNLNDGRPAFFNMGAHHAREWPSAEHAMEWAYELINGFKAGDARATKVVRQSRNLVVPVVNVDGFDASREAGEVAGAGGGRDEATQDTVYIVAGASTGGEYRRKNCRVGDTDQHSCTTSPGILAENGTDPNRNYGGLWGGPGASDQLNDPTYRGPGPFSEPETRNVRWLVSRHQVMSLITNHTTAGLVLRSPGLAILGDPVDEDKGYKALGDAMALENGYFSQKSWELYDTTGTTEDWSYNVTGGFGFTFEIYCGAPNYETGNCDDPAFHPLFETMVKEWDGTSPQSNHEKDPGQNGKFGMQKGYDGKGNREAYYIAAESAINEARHSVIEGDAPPGAKLRLTKEFETQTYLGDQSGGPGPIGQAFTDRLETVYDVPANGKVRWHVNPSTRPIVAKDRGRPATGDPSPPENFQQRAAPPTVPCTPALLSALCQDDQYFTVPPQGNGVDNGKVRIKIEWLTPSSDYDLRILRRGAPFNSQDTLGSSSQRLTTSEEVTILEPQGEYLIRVVNTAATNEPWTGTITYESPDPVRKGFSENWTLQCEINGKIVHTGEFFIARGETRKPDLGACDRRPREAATGAQSGSPSPTAPAGPGCTEPVRGFSAVNARGRGGRVAVDFKRAARQPVTVDVFQQSIGRRVIGERLVARYTKRAKSFTWNGRANRAGRKVTDGYYFVRYRMNVGGGRVDTRRVTLRRVKGRFSQRPSFYRPETCGLLRSFKLTRPVFGGRTNRENHASFRLNVDARVGVVVRQGGKIVRRYATVSRQADRLFRLRLDSENLGRGDYRVTITVTDGGRSETSTLTARRL